MSSRSAKMTHESNNSLETTARNLTFLMERKGVDAMTVAKATGLGIATVNSLRRGVGNPTLATMIALAQYFEVTLTELSEKNLTNERHSSLKVRSIPLVKMSEVEDYLSNKNYYCGQFTTELNSLNKSYFAMRVNNHSLSPQFQVGSICIISEDDDPTDGDIVLVKINNHTPCLRKLFIEQNYFVFSSAISSSEIPPSIYTDFKIIGIVVKIIDVRIISDK